MFKKLQKLSLPDTKFIYYTNCLFRKTVCGHFLVIYMAFFLYTITYKVLILCSNYVVTAGCSK